MNIDEKRSLLDRYTAGPKQIEEAVSKVPKEAIRFRPFIDDAWTIAEHLNHLLVFEANAIVRYRKAIAEPRTLIAPYDQEEWARYVYQHPDSGKVTLEDWLKIYSDHVTVHLDYIDRNFRLFRGD